MQLGVTVVCRESLASGFELAGVEAVGVASAEDARRELRARATTKAWRLVLVEESLMAALPPADQRDLEDCAMPLFAAVPLESEVPEGAARRRVEDAIQRAIGKRIAVGNT